MGTALSEMYQYTMPELPGCSKIQQMRTIVQVIRDWCERTQAWEIDLDAIDLVADVATYEMDSPVEDTEIVAPVSRPSDNVGVKQDGRLLSPGVEYTIGVDKDTLTLYSAPTAASSAGLTIRVAIKPLLSADEDTEVATRLFNDWHDVWAKGTMSRLMRMEGEDWSNDKTGRYYNALYIDGIRLGIAERTRGRTNRSLRVQHPAAFA